MYLRQEKPLRGNASRRFHPRKTGGHLTKRGEKKGGVGGEGKGGNCLVPLKGKRGVLQLGQFHITKVLMTSIEEKTTKRRKIEGSLISHQLYSVGREITKKELELRKGNYRKKTEQKKKGVKGSLIER